MKNLNKRLNKDGLVTKQILPEIKPYFTFRDELVLNDGIIYKG